jgi:N-acetylglucosaminyldiphosphoundecaprenol N-acetyl-beta-D-mannosaminyltransferase
MQPTTPADQTGRAPIAILGVPFDGVSLAEVLALAGEMIASGRPHYATTVGVDFLVQSLEDVELRRILFDAHLVVAEEKAVVLASKILGNPLPENVTVPHLIPQLLALAEQKGWRVFLLGGGGGASEKIRARHPRLKLAGVYAPPEKPLLEMDNADILHRLREARPDILLVAFGSPKQEKWINMNYREAGVPFVLGAGTTFDFLTGAGAARRGGTRILRILKFIAAVLWQRLRLRARKSAPPAGAADITPDPLGNFVIRAPQRLGAAEARAFLPEWLRAVEGGHVMFDLGDTRFADSTGIGALIRLRKRSRELGQQFFLVAPRPPVAAALRMMKLDEFFNIQISVAGARILMESMANVPAVTSGVQAAELRIRWSGEVTALNAVELGVHTESELSQTSPGMTVVVDLSRVTFVDSTGIGLMLRFKKNLQRRDISLKFANPTASVRNVLRHTRLDEYLLGETK